MAAKRFFSESGSDQDQPPEKKPRSRPSFASVIGEVVMVNSLQNFFSALEPMLRRVVHEEVERGVRSLRPLTRSPSLRVQALEPTSLKLVFSKTLNLPIFTGSKITDVDNNPLQILLLDTRGGHMVQANLPQPIKIDIVVLDGDFNPGDHGDNWTSRDFDRSIVRERTGKRPLLTGDVNNITVRDGFTSIGELEFTDNSSWIRSRKFRIGAKVAAGSSHGIRIREAFTEAFTVKDHRGELYKKHHPPMLHDEVWRLEKIGKDGAFHRKLASAGIKSVQDFLKLSTVDPSKLRKILGNGMSEKMWEVTIKHARNCVMGNKIYIFRRQSCILFLNPICQVVRAVIDGQIYPTRDLTSINRSFIEDLVREAFLNWHSLEEVEGVLNEPALLTQGDLVDQYPNHNQAMVKSFQQNIYTNDKAIDLGYLASNSHPGCGDWQIQPTYLSTPVEPCIGYSLSESSSDSDLTPSRPFINGS